jgi:hypothetical protein
MAVKGTSDSLSRCDPTLYSNIYHVRKNPDVKIQPVFVNKSISKDTLEISHDKLKEEALNRLRHTTKYTISQNSFMRIGKYLFLAIAFPPFLMLYGLPKWILVEGLPAIFSMSIWMWKTVKQKSQKQVDTFTHKVVQLMQFIQQIAQRLLIQPIVGLTLEIQQRIRRTREQVRQLFQNIKRRTTVALAKPSLKISEKFKQIQHKLSHVKEKIGRQAQTVAAQFHEALQWIQKSPQVFLGWGQMQVQRLNERALSLSARWNKSIQTSQQVAQQTTHWISHQCLRSWGKIKGSFDPLISLYRQEILPQWIKLKEACKGKWQQTRDFFHQKHQKALTALQRKQEKLKNLSYLNAVDRLFGRVWVNKLPLSFQKWLKKWLYHSFIRAFCDQMIKIYILFAYYFIQAARHVLKALSKGTAFVFRAQHKLRLLIVYATQKGAVFLKLGLRALRLAAFNTIYYSLLGTMIVAILSFWGMRLLADLTGKLTQRISHMTRSLMRLKSKE